MKEKKSLPKYKNIEHRKLQKSDIPGIRNIASLYDQRDDFVIDYINYNLSITQGKEQKLLLIKLWKREIEVTKNKWSGFGRCFSFEQIIAIVKMVKAKVKIEQDNPIITDQEEIKTLENKYPGIASVINKNNSTKVDIKSSKKQFIADIKQLYRNKKTTFLSKQEIINWIKINFTFAGQDVPPTDTYIARQVNKKD